MKSVLPLVLLVLIGVSTSSGFAFSWPIFRFIFQTQPTTPPTTTTTTTPAPPDVQWGSGMTMVSSTTRDVRGLATINDNLYVLSMPSSDEENGAVLEVFGGDWSELDTPLRRHVLPHIVGVDMAASLDGSQLYVADRRTKTVKSVDPETGEVMALSWSIGCQPTTLSVGQERGLLVTCNGGNGDVRICRPDGSVEDLQMSDDRYAFHHSVMLPSERYAILVKPLGKNKGHSSICLTDIQGMLLSEDDCYTEGLQSPVYMAPMPLDFVMVIDRAAEGTLRLYGPGHEIGMEIEAVGTPSVSGPRRLVVDARRRLAAVGHDDKLDVFVANYTPEPERPQLA